MYHNEYGANEYGEELARVVTCILGGLFACLFLISIRGSEEGSRKRKEEEEERPQLVTCLNMTSRLDFVGIIAEVSAPEGSEGR